MPPLSWTGLEKTEEHREIIAARQNPCELISHLHRQPLALEVYIDDPPVDHPPIDGRGLAVGKDDAAAHNPVLSTLYYETLASEAFGIARKHLGGIVGHQRYILPLLVGRQPRAIAAQCKKCDP